MLKLLYRYRHWMTWAGLTLIGGSAGYFYYLYVGCYGSCLISSDPLRSTLWGALIGAIAGFPGLEKWYRNNNGRSKQ